MSVWLILLFAAQGILKIIGYPAWVAQFAAWGYPAWLRIVIGVAELAGAILLFIPGAARIGGILLLGLILGAIYAQATHEGSVIPYLILIAFLGLIFYPHRAD